MSSRILVRDYMKPLTIFFNPDDPIEVAVKSIVQNRVSGGPVLSSERKLLGYLTQQDCLKVILNNSFYQEDHDNVGSIMRQSPLSVGPDDDIVSIAEMIIDNKPKAYPVVENQRVTGIITRTDILKALNLDRQHRT